jgi:hypothetical protein
MILSLPARTHSLLAHCLAITLALSVFACSDPGGSDGDSGDGDGDGSTGGGNGGGLTVEGYVAKCESFCSAFETECGVPCPEDCEGHMKLYTGDPCLVTNDALFQCLLDETPWDCSAESWRAVNVRCESKAHDTTACFLMDGTVSERAAEDDEVCPGSLAYSCAGPTARPECTRADYTTFCCPN